MPSPIASASSSASASACASSSSNSAASRSSASSAASGTASPFAAASPSGSPAPERSLQHADSRNSPPAARVSSSISSKARVVSRFFPVGREIGFFFLDLLFFHGAVRSASVWNIVSIVIGYNLRSCREVPLRAASRAPSSRAQWYRHRGQSPPRLALASCSTSAISGAALETVPWTSSSTSASATCSCCS